MAARVVRVADRHRKKLEEIFADSWPGARNDGWSCERIYKRRQVGNPTLAAEATLKRPLLTSHTRGYDG
jgi:hypothetical protein